MMNEVQNDMLNLGRLPSRLAPIGAVLVAACVAAGFSDKAEFYQSYLVAFLFWLGITLGCLALLMVQPFDERKLGAGHSSNPGSGNPHAASLDGGRGGAAPAGIEAAIYLVASRPDRPDHSV